MKKRTIAIWQVVWTILGIIFLLYKLVFSKELVYSEYLNYKLGYLMYVFVGGVLPTLLWLFAMWGITFAFFTIPTIVFNAYDDWVLEFGIIIHCIYSVICVMITLFTSLKWYHGLFLIIIGVIAFLPIYIYVYKYYSRKDGNNKYYFYNSNRFDLEYLGKFILKLFIFTTIISFVIFTVIFLYLKFEAVRMVVTAIVGLTFLIGVFAGLEASGGSSASEYIVYIFKKK